MQDNQKHYYAFISHSSVDEKMAKWLLRKLEGYHIPVAIQKKYHAPKRLKPIFLFQADLTGNKLRAALDGELTESQYLIVVCSPSAAKSDYVNGEVQHFINSGRCDKIIPFIVAGTPFASLKNNAEEECCPPALVALKGTDNELRGVDLRESTKQRGSKQAAVVDIVATMLGVRFDVMWDRYRRHRIRQAILFTLSSLLLVMAFALTWQMLQPVDVGIRVIEATPSNKELPPCRNIIVRMNLENEQKTDSIVAIGNTLWFHNIPRKYMGRETRIEIEAKEYLPVDTILVLQRNMTLPLCRDASIYGHVRFRLVHFAHPEQADIYIHSHKAQADAEGLVEYYMPLEEQQQMYAIQINNQTDTLDMPCGEDVVIVSR